MESLLWAMDLVALTYLCYWAIRQDKQHEQDAQNAPEQPIPASQED